MKRTLVFCFYFGFFSLVTLPQQSQLEDTIAALGQCTKNAECPMDKMCYEQKCTNPCHSIIFGGCGSNSDCSVVEHRPVCSCHAEYYETINGCVQLGGSTTDCTKDEDCPDDKACKDKICADPCNVTDACGKRAECHVKKHNKVCKCKDGYVGDPTKECKPPCSTTINGITYVKNFTYFNDKMRRWFDAWKYCKNRGMDLATLLQECEWDDLYKARERHSGSRQNIFWVGGLDYDFNYNFFWPWNGVRVNDAYTRWRPGEPTKEQRHCLVVMDRMMASYVCHLKYQFACQTFTAID